jgi:hypothetical protein
VASARTLGGVQPTRECLDCSRETLPPALGGPYPLRITESQGGIMSGRHIVAVRRR